MYWVFKQKPIEGIVFIPCFLAIFFMILSVVFFIFDILFAILFLLGGTILSALTLTTVQWFHVYEDHIEVISVFGKVNEVYFSNVVDVIEKELPVFRTYIPHYVFDDGRKEKSFFETTHQNHHNRLVRIYITDELKELIERKNFNIVQYQRY